MNTYHLLIRNENGGLSHITMKARRSKDLADELPASWEKVRLILTSAEYWKAYNRALEVTRLTQSYMGRSLK